MFKIYCTNVYFELFPCALCGNNIMTNNIKKNSDLDFIRVLNHCFEITGTNMCETALEYGRKCGYLDKVNEITASGKEMLASKTISRTDVFEDAA